MKIVIDGRPLLEPFAHGGVPVYTHELIDALAAHGSEHDWRVFMNGWTRSNHVPVIPTVTTIQKHFPNKLLNLSLFATDQPYLDQWCGGADIFIAPNLNFTSVSPHCTLIQVVHDLSFLVNPSWYSWKSRAWHYAIGVRQLLQRAKIIVAISEATATDIRRHFPEVAERVRVIYPGTPTALTVTPEDAQEIRKKYHLPPRFFFYVGALESRKNITGLLDAFAHFTHTTSYPHELILAGPGSCPKTPRVRRLGIISEKEKHVLLSLAEALVFPSFYEGFGFPPLEAMAHGTPMIASSATSLPEVVGDAGLLVSPYKPHEMAHAMRMIADHADVREDLSRRGFLRAREFTWEKTAKEFLNLCTSP